MLIIAGVVVLFLVASKLNDPWSGRASLPQTVRSEDETVHVGYMSYSVWRATWTTKLSDNEFLNERPNALFLIVEVTARNNDDKARQIQPFYLRDEKGRKYESDSRGTMVDGAIGPLESLNPNVYKRGVVVFDVPSEHDYCLEVSGGYWSSESALIQLSPEY